MQQLKASFPANDIRLVLTPFRIDTTQPMDDALRNYVLGQWQNVHKTSGQPFDFRFTMPADFIYNTSLVCLSIKAFNKQLQEQNLEYLHALQHAFYTENKDLTNKEILIEIARNFAIEATLFADDISSKEVADELESDFMLCQQLAVQSYPTLMTEKDDSYSMLASGYTSYEELVTRIEASVTS
jgi:putative protein-disulfide isomerase